MSARHTDSGTQFTRFTSTQVQILTLISRFTSVLKAKGSEGSLTQAGTQFTRFTRTKISTNTECMLTFADVCGRMLTYATYEPKATNLPALLVQKCKY